MASPVTIETVQEQTIAAVRRRVTPVQVRTAFREPLDQVWAFLRRHKGLRTDGHNVFIYRWIEGSPELDAEFGVQVVRPFDGEGEVVCATTPAGRVAATVHTGPYDGLRQAWDEVLGWCAENGHALAGVSWEVYGDWVEDPAKLETRICILLK
jgi:effector-binding domain-containing protein